MPATARLVVIERFVGPPNQDPVGKFADLGMLVGPGGRERSREELAALLHESGLHVASVTTTGTPLNVLIAEREPA